MFINGDGNWVNLFNDAVVTHILIPFTLLANWHQLMLSIIEKRLITSLVLRYPGRD